MAPGNAEKHQTQQEKQAADWKGEYEIYKASKLRCRCS